MITFSYALCLAYPQGLCNQHHQPKAIWLCGFALTMLLQQAAVCMISMALAVYAKSGSSQLSMSTSIIAVVARSSLASFSQGHTQQLC